MSTIKMVEGVGATPVRLDSLLCGAEFKFKHDDACAWITTERWNGSGNVICISPHKDGCEHCDYTPDSSVIPTGRRLRLVDEEGGDG